MDNEKTTIRTDGEETRKVGKKLYTEQKRDVIEYPLRSAEKLAMDKCENTYTDSYHRIECKDGVTNGYLIDIKDKKMNEKY